MLSAVGALVLPSSAAADHTLATQWGTAGSAPGELSDPTGMDTDSFDNVYVADYSNNRIQKFSPDGELLLTFGSLGTQNGEFNGPKDVAVDAGDAVYVADEKNHRIQKFNSQGVHQATWGSQGTGDGQFRNPYGIAADSGGFVYVADHNNNRVQRLDSTGAFSTAWGSTGTGDGQFNGPAGIAVNDSGTVYVTDYDNDRVQYFTSTGTFSGKWGTAGTGDSQFQGPIAIDADGTNVFVVDEVNGRVTQFDADGDFIAKWDGSTGNQFTFPQGITTGSLNSFFVSDLDNHIQRFDGPINGSVVRTSGSRIIFEADTGDANDVTILEAGSTFTIVEDGSTLTGGGNCTVAPTTTTASCTTSATTTSVRATMRDEDDSVTVTSGATPLIVDGGSGGDTLTGGSGDDRLTGGTGADVMNGAGGTGDVVSYSDAVASVTVDLANAAAQNTGGGGTDTISNVENVVGSPLQDTFLGTAGANSFTGGDGADTVSYANATGPAGVTVDLGAGTATGGDTFSTIENVTGSPFDDTLAGGAGLNEITCLGGTDNVTAELADTVAADCENVTRSDATPGGGSGPGPGGGGGGGAAPGPGAGPAPTAPKLSGLLAPRMRSGKAGTFTYSLDKAAAVTITIDRVQAGRKSGATCKKQTRKNRKKKRCTMFQPLGKLTQAGAAGRNALRFAGKLAGRKLAPGLYRATAVAAGSTGLRSNPLTATFAVTR